MRSILIASIVIFSAFGFYAQPPTSVAQPVVDAEARTRLAAFDKVWNTINEKHYDSTFGGVDWSKVCHIYLPKAVAAKTDGEFNGILRKMLGELKLSHFGIFPKNFDTIATGTAGIGVELKMIDGDPVVWRVEPDSTAASAGLKRGFVLRKIGGSAVSKLLKPLDRSLDERKLSEQMKAVYRQRTLEARITGAAGTEAVLDVATGRSGSKTFRIARKQFKGEMSQPVGNFPAQQVAFESKRLDGNIGYIRFNMWIMPQMSKLRAAVREFSDTKGIVFDLRGNPGGLGAMASGLAGVLMDKHGSLGTMRSRASSISFSIYPQQDPFLAKVVILIDYGSASTSEVFAAGMQELGRATVVGETSAGAVLPSVFEKLPTGAIFQYVISDYRSPRDILIEGRGVKPDINVSLSREALLAGRDTQLEAAVNVIVGNIGKHL